MTDSKPAWDEVDDNAGLSAPEITENPDGTTTIVSYRIDEETGNKIKITQRVKKVVVKTKVEHAVAERKKWEKYGLEKGRGAGPNFTTTNVGENMPFKLSLKLSKDEEAEEEAEKAAKAAAKGSKVLQCRTCGGDHFTSRCPYKEALGGADGAAGGSEPGSRLGTPQAGPGAPAAAAAAGGRGGSTYVPPHQRDRPAGGLTDPGRTPAPERDDNCTLRVTNLSEDIMEDELRALFSRFGRVNRCYLVRDRITGRNRGFAFVSYEIREYAERACRQLNGFAFDNLILHVEFAKK